jgi:hypothetical protein
MPWRRGLVVMSPPTTDEIGAIGREIESSQSIGLQFFSRFLK